MGKKRVPRGFLIVQAEDPNDGYVPFLVKVREEDIIWNDRKDIFPYINQFISCGINDIIEVSPGYSYKFEKYGWLCTIQPDGMATATKAVPIDGNFVFKDSERHDIAYEHMKLPALFLANGFFNVQATACSTKKVVSTAFLNTGLPTVSTWKDYFHRDRYGYREMNLELNNLHEQFDENFVTGLRGSVIFVSIKGQIPLVDYTKKPEENTEVKTPAAGEETVSPYPGK